MSVRGKSNVKGCHQISETAEHQLNCNGTYNDVVIDPVVRPKGFGVEKVYEFFCQHWCAAASMNIKIFGHCCASHSIVSISHESASNGANTHLGHQPWTIPVSKTCSG